MSITHNTRLNLDELPLKSEGLYHRLARRQAAALPMTKQAVAADLGISRTTLDQYLQPLLEKCLLAYDPVSGLRVQNMDSSMIIINPFSGKRETEEKKPNTLPVQKPGKRENPPKKPHTFHVSKTSAQLLDTIPGLDTVVLNAARQIPEGTEVNVRWIVQRIVHQARLHGWYPSDGDSRLPDLIADAATITAARATDNPMGYFHVTLRNALAALSAGSATATVAAERETRSPHPTMAHVLHLLYALQHQVTTRGATGSAPRNALHRSSFASGSQGYPCSDGRTPQDSPVELDRPWGQGSTRLGPRWTTGPKSESFFAGIYLDFDDQEQRPAPERRAKRSNVFLQRETPNPSEYDYIYDPFKQKEPA